MTTVILDPKPTLLPDNQPPSHPPDDANLGGHGDDDDGEEILLIVNLGPDAVQALADARGSSGDGSSFDVDEETVDTAPICYAELMQAAASGARVFFRTRDHQLHVAMVRPQRRRTAWHKLGRSWRTRRVSRHTAQR